MKIGMETSTSMSDTAYSTGVNSRGGRFTLNKNRGTVTGADTTTINDMGMSYELGEGVKVTREQVMFPAAEDSVRDAPVPKAYLV